MRTSLLVSPSMNSSGKVSDKTVAYGKKILKSSGTRAVTG